MNSRIFILVAILFCLSTFSAGMQTPEANSDPGQKSVKTSHGGLRDIDAIGNRNVGCGRGVGNWYTLDKQIELGKQLAQQAETSAKLIHDPVITEYVNRVGQNIVRNSDARVPFTIKVIDDDSINAFALPGGFFYVNSGVLLSADNEAELAGVMAHEIAHVAACHAARQETRGELFNLASIPLIFVGGGVGYAIGNAAGFLVPMTFLKFTRGFETEADYLGLEYMYKAGYDPQAFVQFFEKVVATEKKKPGTLAKVFSSHPLTPDRVAKAQHEIATVLPARDQYVLDTSEFEDVKARLSQLENGRKLENKEDKDRPTLRRAQQPGSKPENGDNGDNDRPTLKRRPENSSPETSGR